MICSECGGIGLDPKYEKDRDPLDFDGAVRCPRCLGRGKVVAGHCTPTPPSAMPPQEWQAAFDRCVALGMLNPTDEALLRTLTPMPIDPADLAKEILGRGSPR